MYKQVNNKDFKWKWKFRVKQNDPDLPGFWIGINDSNRQRLDWSNLYDMNNRLEFTYYLLTSKGDLFRTKVYGSTSYVEPSPGEKLWRYCYRPGAEHVNERKWNNGAWNKISKINIKIEYRDYEFHEIVDPGWYMIYSVDEHKALMIRIKKSKYHLFVVMADQGQQIELLEYKFENNKK